MRICVLTTSYPRFADDEASVFMRRLVSGFSTLGSSGFVVVPRDRNEPEEEIEKTFRISRFRYGLFSKGRLAFGAGIMPNLRSNPLLSFQAPALLAQLSFQAYRLRAQYDLVYANWIPSGVAAWVNYLITGKPYVIDVLGEDARLLRNPFFRSLFVPTLRSAAGIASVGQDLLDTVHNIYEIPKEKLSLIPNGIDSRAVSEIESREFALKKGLDWPAKYLVFIGSVIPRKRVHVLVELLARAELKDFRLLVCGRTSDGSYFDEVKAVSKKFNCSDRVLFQGAVAPSEVPNYLALAQCYLTASEFEGRPNAVLEAFAAKVPVVASDIPAHRAIIEDQKSGVIFGVEDLDRTASEIVRVVSDLNFRQRLVEAAYLQVKDRTWERSAKEHIELFRRAVVAES